MVSMKQILSITALGVLSASAAPPPAAPSPTPAATYPNIPEVGDVTALNDPFRAYIFACEHIRWGGACTTFGGIQPYTCFSGIPREWNDRISSIRNLSRGFWSCTYYEHSQCRGRSYTSDEDANLADGDGFFNDRISSISCSGASSRGAEEEIDAGGN